MGDGLAERFALADEATNRAFTTAKLWGVADSGPWLHGGRALTISSAILMHGGEAQVARDNFDALSDAEKTSVLEFLRSLRTPREAPARANPHNIRSAPSARTGARTVSQH